LRLEKKGGRRWVLTDEILNSRSSVIHRGEREEGKDGWLKEKRCLSNSGLLDNPSGKREGEGRRARSGKKKEKKEGRGQSFNLIVDLTVLRKKKKGGNATARRWTERWRGGKKGGKKKAEPLSGCQQHLRLGWLAR